jgi:effector-binding domain-containing protein
MKKFLRFLSILVLILIVAIIILGLVEPKDVTIERSVVINSPKENVWNQVVSFKNWAAWYPACKLDTATKTNYEGNDGMPGSSFHWISNNKTIGEGTITNTNSDSGMMKYDMKIVRPHSGIADGWFLTAETKGQTKLIWGMHVHCGFPINAALAFVDMDKMMGSDLDLGLKNIKKNLERDNSTVSAPITNINIEEVQFPGHIYYGMRKSMSWNEMNKYYDETYDFLDKIIKKRVSGIRSALFYDWNSDDRTADVAVVYPISDTIASMTRSRIFNVPATAACKVVYKGAYSGLAGAHAALTAYCSKRGMKPKLKIEEYSVSRYDTEDTSKWITNIYYLYDNNPATH